MYVYSDFVILYIYMTIMCSIKYFKINSWFGKSRLADTETGPQPFILSYVHCQYWGTLLYIVCTLPICIITCYGTQKNR